VLVVAVLAAKLNKNVGPCDVFFFITLSNIAEISDRLRKDNGKVVKSYGHLIVTETAKN